ncbi:baseplate J-like family protein [Burkholderia pseudomallei MSHR332]|nr:baseplate J-like family protein [Burkholderia pseudomallei MSHR332]
MVPSAFVRVRPQTDQVIVQSAKVVPYAIRATLRFFSGPDRGVALAEG